MALDEVRRTFSLVRPKGSKDQHYEVWFRGVHSNIGGGYLDRGLSDIALAWMMEMYVWTLEQVDVAPPAPFGDALRLLEPEPGALPDWKGLNLEALDPNGDGELGRPPDAFRQAWREIPPGALVHHSAFRRSSNLLLDHHRSNRRLLRRIPPDAQPVHDPPFFYSQTPRQAASRAGDDAFCHVPVRPNAWLTIDGQFVFRSDEWIAVGPSRRDPLYVTRRESFVTIAAAWLLSGRPPGTPATLPLTVKNFEGEDVLAAEVAAWVIPILVKLEDYVADLRNFRPPPALLEHLVLDRRPGAELV
ncbi:MAG: phospholipase effector Tle1 domain-containing protein, partial [Candidatus Rokuibacteriota bacterium]